MTGGKTATHIRVRQQGQAEAAILEGVFGTFTRGSGAPRRLDEGGSRLSAWIHGRLLASRMKHSGAAEV